MERIVAKRRDMASNSSVVNHGRGTGFLDLPVEQISI
jgi:hypothetical protein